jgi:hypothetical protein
MAKQNTKHHRKCKSHQGSDNPRNISMVSVKSHQSWYQLFGNKTPDQIARIINKVWIDPDFKFIVVKNDTFKDPNQTNLFQGGHDGNGY